MGTGSELQRGAVRVISNYVRLFLLLVMGIVLVPIFVGSIGKEAFGLFGLLGSTLGIAEMCRAIVRESMNRELGAAYHSNRPEEFPDTYNAAIVLSAALAIITAVMFLGLWLLIPVLNIPADLVVPARWFVVTHGVYSTAVVFFAPQFNMYLVSERLILFNTWSTLDRATDVLAAIVLFIVLGIRDPSTGLIGFAFLSAGTSLMVLLTAVTLMIRLERRLVPDLTRIRRENIRKLIPTAGWNSLAVTAMNLHIRIDQVIMNLFFGVIGNAMFTLAVKLTSYVRLLAFGGTEGLDVVSVRLSADASGVSLSELLRHATRLHAILAFPAGIMVLLLAEPLMMVWVGRAVDDSITIAGAVVLAQILVIGMTVRGISDCWIRILYGAGHIRRYAPLIVAGGLCNPLLAIVLIAVLPVESCFKGPAIAFSAIFTIVHFLLIPVITSRCLSISISDVLVPLVRPFLAATTSSLILVLPTRFFDESSLSLTVLATSAFGFAAAHGMLSWLFVLDRHERARFVGIITARLGLRTAVSARI